MTTTKEPTTMTTPTADLERHLDRVRPRLLSLAADLASGGDRNASPIAPDLTAAGLDTIASLATVLAADLRGEKAHR